MKKVIEQVTVNACIFRAGEFGIYTAETDYGSISIKGNLPELVVGETFEIEGAESVYRGEPQINVTAIRPSTPIKREAVILYLQTLTGLNKRAEDIYDVFNQRTIDVLLRDPERVALLVRGVSEKKAKAWSLELNTKEAVREQHLFLHGLGLKSKQIEKLMDKYKEDVISVIQNNPYELMYNVSGYGFKRADSIATSLGMKPDSPERIESAIFYAMEKVLSKGSTVTSKEALLKEAAGVLGFYDEVSFQEKLASLEARYLLVRQEELYSTPYFFYREKGIAMELEIRCRENKEQQLRVQPILEELLAVENIELEEKQRLAVLTIGSSTEGTYILNGGPGCGKTFTINMLCKVLEKAFQEAEIKPEIVQMAPTGRAAKRMAQLTKRPANTIHSALGYNGEEYLYNRYNTLNGNIFIIDESSMLDTELGYALFSAIPRNALIVFIGDVDQLPSIGPGALLKDMINSTMVPTITLDVVKRQGVNSEITMNAKAIKEGRLITSGKTEAFIIEKESEVEVLSVITRSIHRLKELGHTDQEIQVLTAKREGAFGIYNLNLLMQKEFNAKGLDSGYKNINQHGAKAIYFKVGDRVMHIQNNKELRHVGLVADEKVDTKGVMNGELGIIVDIVPKGKYGNETAGLLVDYYDFYALYEVGDLKELDHSFAISIHKSQGSQWDAVIQLCTIEQRFMLSRNLFYTGYTRGAKFHLTIGSMKAIKLAIQNTKEEKRQTLLPQFLQNLQKERK